MQNKQKPKKTEATLSPCTQKVTKQANETLKKRFCKLTWRLRNPHCKPNELMKTTVKGGRILYAKYTEIYTPSKKLS